MISILLALTALAGDWHFPHYADPMTDEVLYSAILNTTTGTFQVGCTKSNPQPVVSVGPHQGVVESHVTADGWVASLVARVDKNPPQGVQGAILAGDFSRAYAYGLWELALRADKHLLIQVPIYGGPNVIVKVPAEGLERVAAHLSNCTTAKP